MAALELVEHAAEAAELRAVGAAAQADLGAVVADVEASEGLLFVGSSLAEFSGYRFVRRAEERGLPMGLVNLGPTRGVRVDAPAGETMRWLVDRWLGA